MEKINQEDKIVASKNGKVIKIISSRCWICNQLFDNTINGRRTFHHAIPKHLSPEKNILVSICQKDHYLVNGFDNVYKKYFLKIKGTFDRIERKIKEKTK